VKYVTFRKCEHSKKVIVFRASEWTRVFSGTVLPASLSFVHVPKDRAGFSYTERCVFSTQLQAIKCKVFSSSAQLSEPSLPGGLLLIVTCRHYEYSHLFVFTGLSQVMYGVLCVWRSATGHETEFMDSSPFMSLVYPLLLRSSVNPHRPGCLFPNLVELPVLSSGVLFQLFFSKGFKRDG